MGIFDNIRKTFSGRRTEPVKNTELKAGRPAHDTRVKSKTPLTLQARRRNYRIDATLKRWRGAVAMAQDPLNPRRELLYMIYQDVMEDPVLLREVRTARFTVQLGDFNIYRNDVADDDATGLFDKPWFFDLVQYYVDTELFGHSLVEFILKDGEVEKILLFPREHVRPELGEIVLDMSSYDGIPYRNELMKRFNLMEIGRNDDLGLLLSCSNVIIRKTYNLTDWGKSNERFGMPFIIDKTASRDKNELDKKQAMLENFGEAGWAIVDDQDGIEFLESKGAASGNGHRTFSDMNEYLDKTAAQLINGQNATSDEKSFVGSAEVQERILNKYTLARMKRIQYHINEVLIPFLNTKGYPLVGCEFRFADLEKKETTTIETGDASDISQKEKKA